MIKINILSQFSMKTILRNFVHVLTRFKVATILNVAGLAVAFAAFLIIMMQVSITSSIVIRMRAGFTGWDFLFRMEQA